MAEKGPGPADVVSGREPGSRHWKRLPIYFLPDTSSIRAGLKSPSVSCKHAANMPGKYVASGYRFAKSEVRGLKDLPPVATPCRSAIQVRAPLSR